MGRCTDKPLLVDLLWAGRVSLKRRVIDETARKKHCSRLSTCQFVNIHENVLPQHNTGCVKKTSVEKKPIRRLCTFAFHVPSFIYAGVRSVDLYGHRSRRPQPAKY